ncbi:MAG TPA: arsinothricin resistance N-acetyltransferase ArsN1 family A [Thermoleophilaceae bacterium]|nr:arsinothricin resistance N-acetyltransferase ArsN1 family A [Thermoleophilaceae bacterium]
MARIRPAAAPDAEAIARIYNQGIDERSSTFETEPRAPADIELWLASAERLPVLVAEDDGELLGWARILAYSDRSAYSGVGEVSVYVDAAARGRGLGRALLEALEQRARELEYWKLVGKLFTDNAASAALVERCGWRTVGLHLKHGCLDGEWRDVRLVERVL